MVARFEDVNGRGAMSLVGSLPLRELAEVPTMSRFLWFMTPRKLQQGKGSVLVCVVAGMPKLRLFGALDR